MSQAPGFSDIAAMADLMGALDDVDSGKATQQVHQARQSGNMTGLNDVQRNNAAMADILADWNSVASDDVPQQPTAQYTPPKQAQPYSNMMQDDMSYEEYLAATQGSPLKAVDPLTGQPPVQTQAVPQYSEPSGDEWILVAEAYSGVKSLKSHSIKNSVTGSVILAGVTLKESATAICHMLNNGISITDPKMLGIISSGVQYTYIVETMVKTLKQKSRVIRESNYDAAKQCDESIEGSKQKAHNIKHDLVTYMNKHGVMYK